MGKEEQMETMKALIVEDNKAEQVFEALAKLDSWVMLFPREDDDEDIIVRPLLQHDIKDVSRRQLSEFVKALGVEDKFTPAQVLSIWKSYGKWVGGEDN